MLIFCILLFITDPLKLIFGEKCPELYQRVSDQHSFCKPRNPKCLIMSAGIQSKKERDEILKEHNSYRSRVAIGAETQAGGLPQASDMMEMVWDDELAAVSQKWAEQCNYKHDCTNCRQVLSFGVGQNIAYKQWGCPSGNCSLADNQHPRNWPDVFKLFYDEIQMFSKNLISSVSFEKKKKYGHFTQMIWAKSWRIGCGYVAYQNGDNYRQLYACNYGPAGNILSKPVYTIGKPCTKCPINSCCGDKCKKKTYPGLCHMLEPNDAPILAIDRKTFLFYCDFGKRSEEDCSRYSTGVKRWKTLQTFSGTILSIVLNAGEESTLFFHKSFIPNGHFCTRIKYRKGPNKAGSKDSSDLKISFSSPNQSPTTSTLDRSSTEVFTFSISVQWSAKKTTLSMTFSVPPKSPPQYLIVESISISKDRCSKT